MTRISKKAEDEQTKREGDLAAALYDHMVATAIIAKFDLTAVTLFLVAELLANLQHYTGTKPDAALQQVRALIAAHLAELAEEAEGAESSKGSEEEANPARRRAPAATKYH